MQLHALCMQNIRPLKRLLAAQWYNGNVMLLAYKHIAAMLYMVTAQCYLSILYQNCTDYAVACSVYRPKYYITKEASSYKYSDLYFHSKVMLHIIDSIQSCLLLCACKGTVDKQGGGAQFFYFETGFIQMLRRQTICSLTLYQTNLSIGKHTFFPWEVSTKHLFLAKAGSKQYV